MQVLRSETTRNQPYKIATTLNLGIVVVETTAEMPQSRVAEPAETAVHASRLSRLMPGWLRPKPVLATLTQPRLFLPYGVKGRFRILNVYYLGENDLKFCGMQGIVPLEGFEKSLEPTCYTEFVRLFATRPVKGFAFDTPLDIIASFDGDRKSGRAVIEQLIPMAKS